MKTRTKLAISLVILAIIDTVIPLPVTAGILIYVLCEKPDWFEKFVSKVYAAR